MPELHLFACVSSTNDVLRTRAAAGAPAGTVAIAELQSAGRGQHARSWEAAPRLSLLISLLLRPRSSEALGAAPIRAGLALARVLEQMTGLAVQLKWPNDVLLAQRKVAGVLCEATTTSSGASIVVGIGVNVAQRSEDFSPDIAPIATSLRLAGGGDVRRGELAGAIVCALIADGERIAEPLDAHELRAFAARDVLRGHAVAIDERPTGKALGITSHGALRVDTSERVVHVHTGSPRIAGTRDVANQAAQERVQ